MAEESSTIALQFAVQMRGLTKVTQLNAALKELKTNVVAIQRNMKDSATNLKAMGAGATAAAKGMRELNKANEASSRTRRGNDPLGRDIGNFQKQQAAASNMYARMFDQIEQKKAQQHATTQRQMTAIHDREARKREARIAKEGQRQSADLRTRLVAWEEHYDAVFRAGFRLQMVGRDMEQVGRAGMAALRGMAEEFGNFEFMVNRAAGAMGIATNEIAGGVNIYDRFQGAIQSAARELKLFNPTEVAKATYFWASTSGQQIDSLGQLETAMKSVIPLMKLAAMTETNYETAIKGVYSILVQYGKPMSAAADVTEKLHKVTQRTAAEFPDLINSFKMVGPIAKENGVSFEEMAVLLGRLADAGIRGTMSGRALRQFFIQISRPAPKAVAALNDLWAATEQFNGASYEDMIFPEGEFIGVNKYVELLATATADLTQQQRNNILATITTANELPVLTALVSKQIDVVKGLGEGWDGSKENMQDAGESFRKSWALLSDSWNGVVGGLTRGMEIIRIQIGGRIAKVFTPVLKALTDYLGRISEWIEDPRNREVIDFFVKLTGFAAGILIVGGAVTMFVGAMISLASAVAVAVGAFGPLVAKFLGITGVIGVFVSAAVRNFDYLRDVVETVLDNLTEAFTGTESGMGSLLESMRSLGAVVAPILDIIIRTVGRLLLILSEVILAISKSGPAMTLLTVAANLLGVALGLRLLSSLLGLGAIVPKVAAATGALNVHMLRAAFSAQFMASSVTKASFSLGGLNKGLGAVGKFLGPMGLLAVGALTFAFLYDNVEDFRDGVDYLFRDLTKMIDDFESRIAESRAAAGQYSSMIQGAINASPNIKVEVDRLTQLTGQYDALALAKETATKKGAVVITSQMTALKSEMDLIDANIKSMSAASYDAVKNDFENLAPGTGWSFLDFLARISQEVKSSRSTFIDAKKAVMEYADALAVTRGQTDVKAMTLMKQFSQGGVRPGDLGAVGGDPTSMNSSKQAIGIMLENMKRDASPEVAKLIEEMLAQATVAGTYAYSQDPYGGEDPPAFENLFSGMAEQIISTGKTYLDFDKILEEIVTGSYNPGSAPNSVFKSFVSGIVSEGFKGLEGSERTAAIARAAELVRDLGPIFTAQLNADSAAGVDSSAYIGGIINNFETRLGDGFGAGVPKALIQEMATYMSGVYAAAQIPIPPEVIKTFADAGVTIVDIFGSSAGAEAPKVKTEGKKITGALAAGIIGGGPALVTAVNNINATTRGINRYSGSAQQWGAHLLRNFVNGLKDGQKDLDYNVGQIAESIGRVLAHSVPKEGPLSDDDVWGLHFVQNFSDGIKAGMPELGRSVSSMVDTIAGARDMSIETSTMPSMSFETNANRAIKVELEVTSPDGSVERLKVAELQQSLMTSDLIRSIEHMVIVG